MPQLYEEAIADIKQLTAAAEDAAKREVLEAIAPRIKSLIEQQIFGSTVSEVEDDEELLLSSEDSVSDELAQAPAPDVVPPNAVSIAPDGDLVIDLDALGKEEEIAPIIPVVDDELTQLDLGTTATEPVSLANESKLSVNDVELNLYKLGSLLESYKHLSDKFVVTDVFKAKIIDMITGVQNTYEYVQEAVTDQNKKMVFESKLENCFKDLQNLQEKAMNLKALLREDDEVTLKLTGVEVVDPDEASVEIEIPEEDADIEDLNADDDEELDLGDETEDELSDDEELDLDDEGSEEDGGEGDDEFDLGDEGSEEDSSEEETDDEPKFESTKSKKDVIVEVDDRVLMKELGKLRAKKEELEETDELEEEETCESTDVKMSEHIVHQLSKNVKERAALRTKIAESKAKYTRTNNLQLKQKLKKELNSYARQISESVARSKKLSEVLAGRSAKKNVQNRSSNSTLSVVNDLKKKLAESNLNNVKLVFVNKLLQNNKMSASKQAQIAEQLDKARTVREANAVYQRAVKSVKTVTENTNKASVSSSRTTQSGQPSMLNENIELARWAKIAGINK
jgi:hypothetical protein